MERILLSHGDGGLLTYELVKSCFLPHFRNETLEKLTDAALLQAKEGRIALSTDAFVVDPIFFPGGDVGKLSICGTVNDLSVSGARPVFMAASFIIEEGFPLADLERILDSMAKASRDADVQVVCGDTKVVGKNQADKIFIVTTGLGYVYEGVELGYEHIEEGDAVVVNGPLGNHGLAVLLARESFGLKTKIESDCAPLNRMIGAILESHRGVKFMRDLTRGGLATCLKEIALSSKKDIMVDEASIPIDEEVRGVCEILGLDPLYLANEGKFLIIVEAKEAPGIVQFLKTEFSQQKACIIGSVLREGDGELLLRTRMGGTRRLRMLLGDPLPRIC